MQGRLFAGRRVEVHSYAGNEWFKRSTDVGEDALGCGAGSKKYRLNDFRLARLLTNEDEVWGSSFLVPPRFGSGLLLDERNHYIVYPLVLKPEGGVVHDVGFSSYVPPSILPNASQRRPLECC